MPIEPKKIPDRPSSLDLRLHAASLIVAQLFNEAHQKEPTGKMQADLMIAYRAIRRHISVGPEGNRWGHIAASLMCKGFAEM